MITPVTTRYAFYRALQLESLVFAGAAPRLASIGTGAFGYSLYVLVPQRQVHAMPPVYSKPSTSARSLFYPAVATVPTNTTDATATTVAWRSQHSYHAYRAQCGAMLPNPFSASASDSAPHAVAHALAYPDFL